MSQQNSRAPLPLRPVDLSPLADRPLFSVLIPNYNYAEFLPMALQSLLDQTYSNFEAIVCDDGSTDSSRLIIQRYARKDQRIRLIAKENGGVASALNAAYTNAAGELIAFLDADDEFKPQKLERVLVELKANPRSGLCAHPVRPVSQAGQPVGAQFPSGIDAGWLGPASLRRGGYTSLPQASGLCIRREIAAMLFPLPHQLKRLLDYYICQNAIFFTEVCAVPEVLADYRLHGLNITGLSRTDDHVLERFVEDVEQILPLQKEFLANLYGAEVAAALRLDDHPWYWVNLLAIRALRGRRKGAIRSFSVEEIARHIPNRFENCIWRFLVLLPRPFSRRACCFWLGSSPIKRAMGAVARPVFSRLTAGTWR